jgi:hypothetical protein
MPKQVVKTTTIKTTANNGNTSTATFTHVKKSSGKGKKK